MLAKWDFRKMANSYSVKYTNLQTGQSMKCGSTEGLDGNDILVYMLEHGSANKEVFVVDGKYTGFLMPTVYEVAETPDFSALLNLTLNPLRLELH
jgi:hypothetical protein